MPPCFCNKCFRVVEDDDRHFCSFYENDVTVCNLPQKEKTAEANINCDETNGKNAEISNHKNGNMCETAQDTGNASQVSTSRVENKGLVGGSFGETTYSAHRPFAQGQSLLAPNSMGILEAIAPQPLGLRKAAGAVPGPSTIHHQTIGPDGRTLYVCDKCSYLCKYKSKFDEHYRKHTGEKPFRCDICGKKFTQKCNLDSHLNTHTGEWPYPCEKCGKGFSHRGPLEIHLRKHTGERPFECQICLRRFSDPSSFRRHVATRCRGPYRCGQCAQTFCSNVDRNRHTMQEHR